MSKSEIDLCLPSERATCPAPMWAFNKKPRTGRLTRLGV